MDAFYASVEQLDHPRLRGLPVLVGHDGPRGVVAAASYESRAFGCRSAQPIGMAKRLCPQAVIVRPRFERYREVSDQVFEIFNQFTPLIEPLSIDEAFLDVTGSRRLLGEPEEIARQLKQRVHATTGLTASVGVATNKFLAKLASDMDKPDGLTVVRPDEIDLVLSPLPIGRIWGIGPKTAQKLQGLGVKTIGDLCRTPVEVLERRVGADAERYRRLAFGQDDRPVVPDHEAKSIGQEQTFGQDLADREEVASVLLEEVEQVGRRLRKHNLVAATVTVKIRFGDFRTVTRRCTLPQPTDATALLWQAAREQFERWASDGAFQPVRLIGMSAGGLSGGSQVQLDLFPDPKAGKQRVLDRVLDRITARFGREAIRRAASGAKPQAEPDVSQVPPANPRPRPAT